MPALTEVRHGAVLVLRPGGPLVQDDAQTLRERAADAVGPSLGRIAIDMSDALYVDSAGLEAMLDIADDLAVSGQALRLSGVVPTVREVLEITGLSSRFEYYDDPTAAVRSFL